MKHILEKIFLLSFIVFCGQIVGAHASEHGITVSQEIEMRKVLKRQIFKADIKKALIFGITGQDGSYLAELLLAKGYEVHGCKRRSSSFNTGRIDHLMSDAHFKLHYADITDSSNVIRLLQEIQPDEVYNLAAQSHVAVSFELPEYTANCDAIGTLRILEGIRFLGLTYKTKFYQASTRFC